MIVTLLFYLTFLSKMSRKINTWAAPLECSEMTEMKGNIFHMLEYEINQFVAR